MPPGLGRVMPISPGRVWRVVSSVNPYVIIRNGAPPTGTSWSGGLGRTRSISSRAWPPRARHWRSVRPSWSKAMTLVDSDTKVDVNTGIVAAGRLKSLIDSRDYSHDLLVMKVQLGQIADAV